MVHRPVYGGQDAVRSAVAAWLAATLSAARSDRTGNGMPVGVAVPDGIAVVAGGAGLVAWDASAARPVAAVDASGATWVVDELADDPEIVAALASRGYRREGMRVTRRVIPPDGAMAATFRATQWTSAAVRAAGGASGAVWK